MKKNLAISLALMGLVGFLPDLAMSAGMGWNPGIYRIHIDGIVYGTPWHMLISTKLDKKTSFDSVSVLSTETSPSMPFKIGPHWSGVRGWVKVEKDGLHYFIRTKKDFYAQPEHFRGMLDCVKDSYKCIVKFSTDSP
ncbi:hypothetical protein [Leptospirillum ferrooxidans]|uniref:Uncharacterized protein n=1 Tax=Leptospirillum ferrooxidans (strain C2-3) TaxID=1162668 RepID=I0ILV7_LEPFC|nr:hypothetical protein [Leptospirillum ferrooxidans]BAM06256.1 hypothetical protein LFE_0540 [Leptospirillum ferrooxidans C2-3]